MKSFALLLAFVSSSALALDFSGIQNWTGSGANEAALVVDFADSGPAFAWGFRFDGAPTSFAMINAIAAADPNLEIQTTFYQGFGNAITGIRYGTLARGGFEPGSSGYFEFLTADGTSSQPLNWSSSQVGVEARTLGEGSWDAYAWAPDFVGTGPDAVIVPAAPVPEPSALAVLATGALAFARRRRRAV